MEQWFSDTGWQAAQNSESWERENNSPSYSLKSLQATVPGIGKQKVGELTLSDTVCHWQKARHFCQWNSISNPEIDPYIWSINVMGWIMSPQKMLKFQPPVP